MLALGFLHPGLLWLLLALPVVFVWPRRTGDHGHASLRACILGLLTVALAAPVRVTADEREHHVFIADTSASAAANTAAIATADPAVADLATADLATSDLATADVAAADLAAATVKAALDALPANATPYLVGIDCGIDDPRFAARDTLAADSDLAAALALAATRIPEGSRGAVTLLTDGLSTNRRWAAATQALTERGIPLHTVALPRAGIVRPVRFAAVSTLRVGQTGRLFVDVAGPDAEIRVRITGGDGVVGESAAVRLTNGRCRVAVEFEPERAGYLELTATVLGGASAAAATTASTAARPATAAAAAITNTFAVQDPIRVLYLGGRVGGSAARLAELLGRGFDLHVSDGGDAGAERLAAYDLVMLDDRPAKDVPSGFQKQVVAAVTDQGLGLCMSGGGGSFGPGGYHDTPIESVLPVDLVQKEEKKDPSTALAIIIDTSGSMGGNRIVLAKEVTRLALRRLLPHDKVGIVEFFGNKRWAAPLQSAANAIDIQRALNRLDAGGGTILYPAIEEAYFGLRNVQTRYKHVLVLTDAGVESGPYERLLRRMSRDGICVSTVLVGPGRHSEFLVELADWGRGRFYNASDRFNLPEIMLKQPSSARLPGYRAGVQVVEAQGGRGWWGDTDPRTTPAIHGYVETRRRRGAEVLLRTRRDRHPVLASWRFGLGRVTAMTTEPTGPGTAPFRDWQGYGPFLARVLSRTAAGGRLPFRFELRRRDHELVLTARRVDRGTALPTAHIDDATRRPFAFRERAPGHFEARLAWPAPATARVLAGVEGRARGARRLASHARADRAAELQVDPANALDLAAAAAATGGTAIPARTPAGTLAGSSAGTPAAPLTLATGGGDRPRTLHELWPLCMLLALVLYLCDLFWRRRPSRPGGTA